jgi:predicted nucleic acid-binding protein
MESAVLGLVVDASVLVAAERSRQRRQFLDELRAHVSIHPITEATAEIIARIGAEQAAKGINLPLADLIIGACALQGEVL